MAASSGKRHPTWHASRDEIVQAFSLRSKILPCVIITLRSMRAWRREKAWFGGYCPPASTGKEPRGVRISEDFHSSGRVPASACRCRAARSIGGRSAHARYYLHGRQISPRSRGSSREFCASAETCCDPDRHRGILGHC